MNLYDPLTEADAKHIRELLRSASARKLERMFVVEGPHLVEMAAKHAFRWIEFAAYTERAAADCSEVLGLLDRLGVQLRPMSEKLNARVSETESPQGILAVINNDEAKLDISDDLFVLALDAIQDPGNIGTIIRTASWFGIRRILLGPGCADPYSPKVTRSTQGAIFTTEVEQSADLQKSLSEYQKRGYHIIASALGSQAVSLYDSTITSSTLLVLGSEAHGVHPSILQLADQLITIPESVRSTHGAESLNVATATAIIISELARKNPSK